MKSNELLETLIEELIPEFDSLTEEQQARRINELMSDETICS